MLSRIAKTGGRKPLGRRPSLRERRKRRARIKAIKEALVIFAGLVVVAAFAVGFAMTLIANGHFV